MDSRLTRVRCRRRTIRAQRSPESPCAGEDPGHRRVGVGGQPAGRRARESWPRRGGDDPTPRVLERAIGSVLRYADQGTTPLVLTTTLANGVAEEVFFRGSVYAAAGASRPVLASTAVYGLAT